MTVIQVLRRARALVAKGWTRRVWARDSGWRGVDPASKKACQWCADGALHASAPTPALYEKAAAALTAVVGGVFPPWNDAQKSKKPVLAAFDKAIASVRK